eukprot:905181-Alexandrium_andersonii.AAC.1
MVLTLSHTCGPLSGFPGRWLVLSADSTYAKQGTKRTPARTGHLQSIRADSWFPVASCPMHAVPIFTQRWSVGRAGVGCAAQGLLELYVCPTLAKT